MSAATPAVVSTTPVDAAASASAARAVMPTVFLTHGGGPSYFMEVPQSHPFYAISSQSTNAQWLRDFTKTYKLDGTNSPKAIVVVSAHWMTSGQKVRISNQQKHTKLNYDYGGFPAFTYKLEYNPPGSPVLAARIAELLTAGGVQSELDSRWNFDHGVFIPLKMIFPEANIPVVELSIDRSYDPAWHHKVGEALQQLKHEGVLLIASGSSTHNFNPSPAKNAKFMKEFAMIVERPLSEQSVELRAKRSVLEWSSIPSARDAHPEEDHFVPYFVAVGAAGDQKAKIVGKVEPAGGWNLASVLFE